MKKLCFILVAVLAVTLLNRVPGNLMENGSARINAGEEEAYVDFTMNDMDGTPLSLKSVVEKKGNRYVLLDFWASWCGPCMMEVPYLVKAYSKYKAKGFEIFGCSLDNRKEYWKAAVSEKGMDWVQVSDLKGWENAGAVEYGVRSIPANFLIDCTTGKIIASGLRGNALEKKLSELFGE